MTVPKPFRFHATTRANAFMEIAKNATVNSPFVPLAVRIQKFESAMPDRFKARPPKVVDDDRFVSQKGSIYISRGFCSRFTSDLLYKIYSRRRRPLLSRSPIPSLPNLWPNTGWSRPRKWLLFVWFWRRGRNPDCVLFLCLYSPLVYCRVLSTEEREIQEIEKAGQFKAHPVNRKVCDVTYLCSSNCTMLRPIF